jgi:hypothetical protein
MLEMVNTSIMLSNKILFPCMVLDSVSWKNFVFDRRNLVRITVFIFVPCQKKLITINSFISIAPSGGRHKVTYDSEESHITCPKVIF